MTVVSSAFRANGLQLAVHDFGGAGRPVLFAHATGFHGRMWQPMAERMVAAGFHAWSFDFHGHGDSDAPPTAANTYSWDGFADDVLAVAAHLGLGHDPNLITAGHSKGAAALLLGEANRPGTFARIWAYEPIIFDADAPGPPDHDFFLARAARKRRNEWASREEAFTAYAAKPPLNAMTDESLRAYVDYGLRDRGDGVFELKCPPEIEAQVYTMAPNHGGFKQLPMIAAAVDVVCGETSTSIDPPRATRIAAELPNARVEVIPGCGHFGPQQDPDACVASILAFASE